MADFDILTFGRSSKASYKAAHRAVKTATSVSNHCPGVSCGNPVSSQSESNNSTCEYISDEDGERKHRRAIKRKHKSHVGGKVGSLASSLIHNKPITIEPCVIKSDSEGSDSSLSGKKIKKQILKSYLPNLDDSASRSPSPQPSPPPPGSDVMETPSDHKSKRALSKATHALNQLMYSLPASDYSLVEMNDPFSSVVGSASKDSITLRIRYRGKIHKYTVHRGDPFAIISNLLATELGESESTQFSFSHKTVTIRENDSPLSLDLSTADIIDAFMVDASFNDSLGDDIITIKVQSSCKSKVYCLCRKDPLQKVIQAFAKELDVSLSSIQLYFDGVPISPMQTANDLDMDDDDCIDARLM